MTIKETLPYNQYEIRETRRSQIDKSRTDEVRTGFRYPKCKAVHKPLEHSQSLTCKCGLQMQLWGNGLECTLEKSD